MNHSEAKKSVVIAKGAAKSAWIKPQIEALTITTVTRQLFPPDGPNQS